MATSNRPLYRPRGALDVLDLPLMGRVLKWRWGRLVMQVPLALIALFLLIDGFTGPDNAARNLATVAPWVHYRGLVIIALLLAGNLFCMGCPFTIPRTLAKRLSTSGRRFPKVLRNKWVAIAGLFVLFFLYEYLDLWASPVLTAWVIVFYFAASFVLEAVFTESAFCKYVCPLGTFNFVYSTLSPTQIGVKDREVCRTCVGKECISGNYNPTPIIRLDDIPSGGTKEIRHGPEGTLGCGTLLFAPQITSNLECTMCLDCVRACPHHNIGLMTRQPGRELLRADAWPKRWDVSFLVIILAFMGITNAFGMVPPVYELMQSLAERFGFTSEFFPLFIVFIVGNLILPVALTLVTAQLARMLTRTKRAISLRDTVTAFAPGFVPLGFGIWMAHYGFHFLIAPLTIIPVLQEFFGGVGDWTTFSAGVSTSTIGLLQMVVLLGGFLWSMVVTQRAALRLYKRQGLIGLMPFALLLLLMMFAAIQIFSLPMEMRGTPLIG